MAEEITDPHKWADEYDKFLDAGRHLAIAVRAIREEIGYDDLDIARLLRTHANFFEERAKRRDPWVEARQENEE